MTLERGLPHVRFPNTKEFFRLPIPHVASVLSIRRVDPPQMGVRVFSSSHALETPFDVASDFWSDLCTVTFLARLITLSDAEHRLGQVRPSKTVSLAFPSTFLPVIRSKRKCLLLSFGLLA